ncbi:beta-ketoacyl synthase N-terminal-like domain-containing protein [Paraburkholderia dilworthii]|uniref:beta-ketoacyl synthase N-terminal-like domain-containing protein n=1 Tax=Paraburkholderia dilworthii TaxID=948106 RepID=UPI0004032F53|nr:beta-ketoacyl synthase N-terminal-like domain-containing protein [Paraburkholderia dilworthii]
MKLTITGSAMTTCVGLDKASSFASFCAGISGRKPLQFFPAEHFNVRFAYEIADGPDRTLRASELLAKAVADAIADAALIPEPGRCAVLVGTGLRELRSLELSWTEGRSMTVDQLHFENALNSALGIALPVITVCNACAASNFTLALAEDFIRDNAYDCLIVAGCDTITESMFGLLDRVNPLHPDEVRPFDRDRKGVLMGDGAAAVVLETPAHAAARGARALAVLAGVGTSCDANHETAPDVDGISRAVGNAYERAGIGAADVHFIMAHGTGTSLNDKTEAVALRAALGDAQLRATPLSAIKSMTGHTSGASGLIGVVTAIESLRTGQVPPTARFSHPMEEAADLDIIHGEARTLPEARIAQVDAFGFGGVNAVAILEKSE